jgi:catechol 2,3-dioxygenase-like lactoylglutathione lyase family enzyme
MTTAFWHVGLTVSNLARSAAFYRDVAGMAEGEHLPSNNAQFGLLVNNPGATLNSVCLAQNGFTLQLLEYLTQGGKKLAVGHNNIGSPHLAFFVPDVQAHYDAVQARGDVAITSGIITNACGTIRSFYVDDPDGVPVEFVETLEPFA